MRPPPHAPPPYNDHHPETTIAHNSIGSQNRIETLILDRFIGNPRFIFIINGLRYKEYQLQDYGSWFIKKLNDTHNWKHIRSCFVKTEICNNLPRRYRTLKQYKLAHLTPIEAGCCRPPSQCGYPAVNASYYDLSFHPMSSIKTYKLYKNSKSIKCYNYDSCKSPLYIGG